MDGTDKVMPAGPGTANTLYVGTRWPSGDAFVTANGRQMDPKPSMKLRNHSPNGFEWGYWGSGPAQLALALLLDATQGNEITALDFYQVYKIEVVSKWPRMGWVTTRAQIMKWLTTKVCPLPGADLGGEGGAG